MPSPNRREIRAELKKSYGHVTGAGRLWNIRIAHAFRSLGETTPVRKLWSWHSALTTVLKIEDQVLKSYDRMAGVYNEVNQSLRQDATMVFCKYDGQYVRREAREIYEERLVFRP